MKDTHFITIDSTYRDREKFPLPSNFEIEIAQSGTKDKTQARDPVSFSAPIKSWISNTLEYNSVGTPTYTGQINTTDDVVCLTNDTQEFILVGGAFDFQPFDNYYTGLTIVVLAGGSGVEGERKRIVSYKYLGNNFGLFVVETPLSGVLPINISFTDPTNFSVLNPIFFVPTGFNGENSYSTMVLFNENLNEYAPITYYSDITKLLMVDNNFVNLAWVVNQKLSIRSNLPIVVSTIVVVSPSEFTLNLPPTFGSLNTNNNFYKGDFIRRSNVDNQVELYSRIISYTYDPAGPTATFTINPPLPGLADGDRVEILQFSRDNYTPIVYSGSTISQQEPVCYEIELLTLSLPNRTLISEYGSRIAFYPYVLVELTNLSAMSNNVNALYSNSPHTTRILFKVAIYDINNPLSTTFVKNDGMGARQTIKFKPNDNLRFSVKFPNGQYFQTLLPENFSPQVPNALIQINAVFSIRRTIKNREQEPLNENQIGLGERYYNPNQYAHASRRADYYPPDGKGVWN